MLRELARASVAMGALGGLLSCSDPAPPSPKGALENTVQNASGTHCPATHTTLSIGDQIDAIQANGGTERVTNGKGGAIVKCEIRKTDTGFSINGTLKAQTVQTDPQSNLPFTETFEISGTYPSFTPGSNGTATIFTNDTETQRGYTDDKCTITVKSLGETNEGGALWATYVCSNFSDPATPDTSCRLVGSIVFENCDK